MATKNSSLALFVFSLGLFVSCAKAPVRTDPERGRSLPPSVEAVPTGGAPTPPSEGSPQVIEPSPTTPPLPPRTIPKISLIFGPGGARVFAQIGFLQELQKYKIPVISVAGLEWGAVTGAFYSVKGSLNDVEWQMNKIKGDDFVKRSIVSGSKMAEASSLDRFFSESIGRYKVEESKLPFVCPAFNIKQNQVYLMNKGSYQQLLPYCLSYPPLFKAHNSNVSAIREVKILSDHLRHQGSNFVILINVLGSPGLKKNITGDVDSAENIYWNEIAGLYSRPIPGIDAIVNLRVDEFTLFDFDQKRDIIQKGSAASSRWVKEFAQRYGF